MQRSVRNLLVKQWFFVFLLRLKRKNEGALEQPHQLTEARKQIARIKTLMTEKAGETHVN